MGLSEKLKKFEEKSDTSKKDSTRNKRTIPKSPKKLVIPEHIKILFDDIDKSIESIWGIRENGKPKWVAKYKLWLVFKNWFEGEVSK